MRISGNRRGYFSVTFCKRTYSETSEWIQASKELSEMISLEVIDIVWLSRYRHITLAFWMNILECKDICSKNEFLLRVRKLLQSLSNQDNFPKRVMHQKDWCFYVICEQKSKWLESTCYMRLLKMKVIFGLCSTLSFRASIYIWSPSTINTMNWCF